MGTEGGDRTVAESQPMKRRRADRAAALMPLDETDIHRAVVQHLDARAVRGAVFFHPANGGWRRHVEAARFVGLGVKPGVADLIFAAQRTFSRLGNKSALQEPRQRGAKAICCRCEKRGRAGRDWVWLGRLLAQA